MLHAKPKLAMNVESHRARYAVFFCYHEDSLIYNFVLADFYSYYSGRLNCRVYFFMKK